LPLLLVSPGAATLGLATSSLRAKAGLVAALGIAVAVAVTIGLDLSATQIGCTPVVSPLEPLLRSTVTGTVAGIGYGTSVSVALALASRHQLRWALAAGGLTLGLMSAVTGLAFFAAFPVVSCAAF
jgi:hypothetical protein